MAKLEVNMEGTAAKPKSFGKHSSASMPDKSSAQPGTAGVFQTALWWGGLAVFVFLSTLALPSEVQLVFSTALLAMLVFCYQGAKWATGSGAKQFLRLAIIFICSFLLIRYLHWRITQSMPMQFGAASMVCGLLLFAAELYTIVTALSGYFINAQPYQRKSLPLPEDKALLPSVDVYIPTYNEDPAIIRATVIAATQMNYPANKLNVYILDDGGTTQKLNDPDANKREAAFRRASELKAIAERYSAGYITREKNVHAKAGNMSNALKHTTGEFLVILDCDHIPADDFVARLVGFFLADPTLFVVQTPHNFVSPDPLERNLDTYQTSPAENELFYDVMQPGLDSWGTSFFCGSAAMLRREVIDQLGGISGQTITEDAETTLDALALGYTSAYYGRPMVSGLQPETYAGFVIQRVRWGQGMWQIFLLKNPWKVKGLKLIHRLLYTNFAFYWGFAFARLIMLLAPPVFLIFGINLCDATSIDLISYAGPALLGSLIATQYFFGRVRWPFVSQLYEVLQSFYVAIGLVEVLRKPRSPAFKVTPKGETLEADFLSAMSMPYYLLLALNTLALFMGIDKLSTQTWSQGAVSFVMFWAVLDMILLLGALGVMFEQKQSRKEPRVIFQEPLLLKGENQGRELPGIGVDVSANGIGIHLSGDELRVSQFTPGARMTISIPGQNAELTVVLENCRRIGKQTLKLGFSYHLTSVGEERTAIRLAFGSSERLIQNNALRHTGRSIIGSLQLLIKFALVPGREHLIFWLKSKLTARKAAKA